MSATERQSKLLEDDERNYDDFEENCGYVLDNVSKTSTTFTCYPFTRLDDSKLRTHSCVIDDSATYINLLRKRIKSTNTKTSKRKNVQFVTTSQSAKHSSGATTNLKKIVFNGTFPIDAPYSSRF